MRTLGHHVLEEASICLKTFTTADIVAFFTIYQIKLYNMFCMRNMLHSHVLRGS